MICIPNSTRLRYRLMTPSDADLLHQLDQNPNVMRYINGGKLTSLNDIINVYIPRLKSFTNPEKGWGLWKVTLLDSNEFIGWILVRPMDFFSSKPQWHNLEIGWRFKEHSWGKGLATEAAKQVKQYIAADAKQNSLNATLTKTSEQNPNVTCFTAVAMAENGASIAIMKKIGLSFIKAGSHKDPLGDCDVVYYQEVL